MKGTGLRAAGGRLLSYLFSLVQRTVAGCGDNRSTLQGRAVLEPSAANTSVTSHPPPEDVKQSSEIMFQETEVSVEHFVPKKREGRRITSEDGGHHHPEDQVLQRHLSPSFSFTESLCWSVS